MYSLTRVSLTKKKTLTFLLNTGRAKTIDDRNTKGTQYEGRKKERYRGRRNPNQNPTHKTIHFGQQHFPAAFPLDASSAVGVTVIVDPEVGPTASADDSKALLETIR